MTKKYIFILFFITLYTFTNHLINTQCTQNKNKLVNFTKRHRKALYGAAVLSGLTGIVLFSTMKKENINKKNISFKTVLPLSLSTVTLLLVNLIPKNTKNLEQGINTEKEEEDTTTIQENDSLRKENDSLREENNRLTEEKNKLKEENNKLKEKKSRLKENYQNLHSKINKIADTFKSS